MKIENQLRLGKIDKAPVERPKNIPGKGIWRDDDREMPKLISIKGNRHDD